MTDFVSLGTFVTCETALPMFHSETGPSEHGQPQRAGRMSWVEGLNFRNGEKNRRLAGDALGAFHHGRELLGGCGKNVFFARELLSFRFGDQFSNR
jgi:hypothetical protein